MRELRGGPEGHEGGRDRTQPRHSAERIRLLETQHLQCESEKSVSWLGTDTFSWSKPLMVQKCCSGAGTLFGEMATMTNRMTRKKEIGLANSATTMLFHIKLLICARTMSIRRRGREGKTIFAYSRPNGIKCLNALYTSYLLDGSECCSRDSQNLTPQVGKQRHVLGRGLE